jgi:recombination protein RecA
VSLIGDLLDVGAENNVVEKSGSWYSFAGERIGQGRENAKAFLRDHPETLERVDREVRLKLGLTRTQAPAETPEPEVRAAKK